MIKGKSYTLMTEKLFSEDAYIRSGKCKVLDITSNGTIIIATKIIANLLFEKFLNLPSIIKCYLLIIKDKPIN